MKNENIIANAINNGRQALSEYESKLVLSSYGIPVTREVLVFSPDEAVDAAEKIGYPVVVKACSPELMHKSEGGLVELRLSNPREVKDACKRINQKTNSKDGGILVQEMVGGSRELVIGLNRDLQFGPCIMLGLGGVMTELLQDIVFRMAPIDEIEAGDMMDELKSKKMFGAFRGQNPVDANLLKNALIAVGKIGLNAPEVQEIDINPLIIEPGGNIKAVDALIVLRKGM